MTPVQSPAQRTVSHWESDDTWESAQGLYWLELPLVQRRWNLMISGEPEVDWLNHTLQVHFPGKLPLDRCLSLGCGRGNLERALARRGAFVACDALDIASASIDRARALARDAGYNHIHYSVQDANYMELPAEQYDAIWAAGAFHHFERLEHICGQLAAALKSGGLLILKEYIGPNRFQFPPSQRRIIRACYDLLPLDYRRSREPDADGFLPKSVRGDPAGIALRVLDKLRDGDLLGAVGRRLRRKWAARSSARPVKEFTLPSERSVQAVDPSEAVRSADIVPVLRRSFDIVEFKPLGGSILQFLLAGIAGNFGDGQGGRLLEMLFAVEDALIACGELDSDFAYIVAAPPSSQVSGMLSER